MLIANKTTTDTKKYYRFAWYAIFNRKTSRIVYEHLKRIPLRFDKSQKN